MDIMQATVPGAAGPRSRDDARLRQAAVELEATFLAEMLKSAGLGDSRGGITGGAGESQFSSVMVRAQAEQIARAGGLGLSEVFLHALREAEHAAK